MVPTARSTVRLMSAAGNCAQASVDDGSVRARPWSQPLCCSLRGVGENGSSPTRQYSMDHGSDFAIAYSVNAQEDVARIIRHSAEANESDWAAVPKFDNSERDRNRLEVDNFQLRWD
jgi:hypothetical protein